ncbi:MAG: ubiquitin-conjugating enzyme E2 [Thermoplasmata archaeon]
MALPKDVLRIRLKNEVEICQRELRHHLSVSDSSLSSFPILINVTFLRVPGPSWEDGKVVHRFVHRMAVLITDEYPVEKPIVKWRTAIFHPNIMPPEDGGYVCTKLLENWDFSSTLLAFVRGVEWLLVNPNPSNPFGSDTCTRAAEYFNRNAYTPPASVDQSDRRIRIIGEMNGQA